MFGVGGGQAMEFDVILTTTSSSDAITGSNNWAISAFLSDSSDGSNPIASETAVLTNAQKTVDLSANGEVTLSDLAVTLDLEDVECDTFQYVCASVAPSSAAAWKVDATSSLTNSDTHCVEATCAGCIYRISLLVMVIGLFVSRLL